MLFAIWPDGTHRPTRDVDLLGFGPPNDEELKAIFPGAMPNGNRAGRTIIAQNGTSPSRPVESFGSAAFGGGKPFGDDVCLVAGELSPLG